LLISFYGTGHTRVTGHTVLYSSSFCIPFFNTVVGGRDRNSTEISRRFESEPDYGRKKLVLILSVASSRLFRVKCHINLSIQFCQHDTIKIAVSPVSHPVPPRKSLASHEVSHWITG